MINYQPGMKLELWVRDTGLFDGFAVYVDGSIAKVVGDQKTHKFKIPIPDGDDAIAINFGGQDGGTSAVIDVDNPGGPNTLETQTGVNHAYIIHPVVP